MKKTIAIMLTAAVTAAQLCGFPAAAEEAEVNYAEKTLEEVYADISGEDYVMISDWGSHSFVMGSNWGSHCFTIDSSGKFHIIEKRCKGTEITVAKGSELPVEDIKKAAYMKYIDNPQIKKNSNGVTYSLNYGMNGNIDVITEILSSYDCVLSIDENYEVCEDTANYFGISAFYADYDGTAEEFMSRYPELGLSYKPDKDYMANREGYDYYFGFKWQEYSYDKLFESMVDMDEKGIKYYLGADAFYVSYDGTAEEFMSSYPDTGLVYEPDKDCIAKENGYDYYFGFEVGKFSGKAFYEALKDMNENGIGFSCIGAMTELAYLTAEKYTCTNNLYTKADISDKLRSEIRKLYRRPAVQGDANCDNSLDLADAIYIMQALANPNKYRLSEQGRFNADVDGNGVTVGDAQAVQDLLLGLG